MPSSGKQTSQNVQTRKENQGPPANFAAGSKIPGPPKYPGQPMPDQKNPSGNADAQNYPNQPRYPNSQAFLDQPSRLGYPSQPRYPNPQLGFNNPQGYPNQLSYYNSQELLNQPVNPSYQGNPNEPGYRDSQVFPNPPYPQGYPGEAGYPKSKGSSIQVDAENTAGSVPNLDNFDRNSELKYPGAPLNLNRLPNQVPMKSQKPSQVGQPGNFNIQLDKQNIDPSKQKSNSFAFDGAPAVKSKPPFPENPSMSQSDKLNESPDPKSSLLQSLGQTGNVPGSVGNSPPDTDLTDQLPPPPNVNLPVGMPPPPIY